MSLSYGHRHMHLDMPRASHSRLELRERADDHERTLTSSTSHRHARFLLWLEFKVT
jgi:hypothetical protein